MDVGTKYGFGATVDVCELPVGHNDFCSSQAMCALGEGDCDSDEDCVLGLTCVKDVGASYGYGALVDVCL